MKFKFKHIIGMIWWQFRKKKIKRELFERIKTSNPSKYQSRIFKPNLRQYSRYEQG